MGLQDAVVGRGRQVQIARSPSFLQGFRTCVQFDLGLERVHKGGVVPSRRTPGRWGQAFCYLHMAEMATNDKAVHSKNTEMLKI